MQKRHIVYNIQGMGQDVVSSPQNTTMAYEIKNMRLTPTGDSNALELTTERGTQKIQFVEIPEGPNGTKLSEIQDATVIGYCIIQNYIILFIKGDYIYDGQNNIIGGPDYIYRLQQWNGKYKSKLLFEGNLNFDVSWEIEATSYFENTKIQKVYWVDGRNQPRVINIYGKEDDDPFTENPTFPKIGIGSPEDVYTEFDFLQEVLTNEEDPVTHHIGSSARIKAKKIYTGGNFTSGVIQYAYSLYTNNSQETPLIDTTSLLYITHNDRGGAPNEQCNCSFELTIENKNLKNKFDYIRVYSIQRNSLNGTPLARVVADIPFDEEVTIIDDGNGGYDTDYNQLQYQRIPMHPLTLTQKDNVLFMGNYELEYNVNDLSTLYNQTIDIWCENWYPELNVGYDDIYAVKVYDENDISVYSWLNQLNTESAGVKTFKYGETYKLGVQFQDKYGNWSQPYFIKDIQQTLYPQIDVHGNLHKPIFACSINEIYDALNSYEKENYVRIRPVVSFPSITERSVLCQGVLNPTIFNITERCNKTCYAQSSWFFRPFIPNGFSFDSNDTYGQQKYGALLNYHHYDSLNSSMDIGGEIQGMYYNHPNSQGDFWYGDRKYLSIENNNFLNDINKYKNFYYIDQTVLTLNSSDIEFNSNMNSLNLESYDLKINGIIQLNNTVGKYNIISQSPLCINNLRSKNNLFDNTLNTRSLVLPYGFYDYPITYCHDVNAIDQSNGGILCAQNCWFDDVANLINFNQHTVGYDSTDDSEWNYNSSQVSYYVYPWQRNYLNNYSATNQIEGVDFTLDNSYGVFMDGESSKITSKILANLRYSLNTRYFNNSFILDTDTIKLYNNQNLINLKNNKLYSGNFNKYYNYDKYVASVFKFELGGDTGLEKLCALRHGSLVSGYPITVQGLPLVEYQDDPVLTRGFDFHVSSNNTNFKYRIDISKPREFFDVDTALYFGHHSTSSNNFYNSDRLISSNGRSTDAIEISYKSPPHIVLQTKCDNGIQTLIPSLEQQINTPCILDENDYYVHMFNNDYTLPWNDLNYDNDIIGYKQKLLNNEFNNAQSYLLSASLYKKFDFDENGYPINSYLNRWNTEDDPNNPYLENISNLYLRNWIPAGKAQQFIYDENDPYENLIAWIEGDTYYQRYDCVKTKPYSDESYQSVIEILSFMVESNINLDGRYDKNRGILDYTIISDDNFNLFNDVYNQENNFFTYHILDPVKFNIDEFRNDIVWSTKKVSGESIDQWTKLSPVNQLQLDGNKGFVKALRKFNDNIYCFQDHAISRIRFNDRTAIATESGEPLQLAYTNYVDGYEYINSDIGCQYGISCCETENGIFFIDNDIPGIYKLSYNEYGNINVKSISRERFMQHWFEKYGNVLQERVFFDKIVNEILFLNETTLGLKMQRGPHCLVYSCDMNSFQQFINDYGKSKYITTHNEWPISITDIDGSVGIWKLRSYKYSQFLSENNTPSPYSITLVASPLRSNEGLFLDCIYDNVSFKSNVFRNINDSIYNSEYQPNESFNRIIARTVYQSSNEALQFTNQPTHSITNLRKKFGSWFARIPKFPLPNSESVYGRYNKERMRGNYLFFTLEKRNQNINDKMVLTELSVDCFY